MKKFNIIAGLPRSGSTLLANILNQNPKLHASETSGLVRILSGVKGHWEEFPEHRASIDWERKKNVLKSIPQAYYQGKEASVVFDKNRAWMSELEMAELTFGKDCTYILCVRSLTEILASFEKLYRKQNGYHTILDKKAGQGMETMKGRLETWSSANGPIGSTLIIMKELIEREVDHIIVEFENLTTVPELTIKKLYKRLGLEDFEHDFTNVKQTTEEEDFFHGMLGLHDIRNKVEPVRSDAKKILGEELYKKYSGGEFWRDN